MSSYEDLHRQSCILENKIDKKLISFSKACAGSKTKLNSYSEPLLSPDHIVDSASAEIEGLLDKLTNLNQRMATVVEKPGNNVIPHTLKRHREILQDYSKEYRNSFENYKARKEKEALLNIVQKELDLHKGGSGINRRNDLYMKENELIRSSDRLIDDQISIAVETREHLLNQRVTMKKLQTRLHDISNRFPILNSLIQRVNFHKRRNSIIIGLVVFVCTFLLLIYAFY